MEGVRWNAIRPHLGFLFDLAMRETGRAADAEDVVQEVAASALRARDPEMPRAYLAGAVLLRARQMRRGETRRRAREMAIVAPRSQELPDRAALVRDEVERALGSLDPEERRAVVLRHLHDLDYGEIGAALGISAAAARQRVHRALARLRERFGTDGEAALALLPLFVTPRTLAGKPFLGALLMKISTKAAVAVLALAAGAAVGAATARKAATVPSTPVPLPPPAPPEPVDVGALRAELAKYPLLDDADLLVYSDTSLRGKLAAIDDLPEDARMEAVRRIGERMQKSGKGVEEALALLRDESDPRVLFWLADVLSFLSVQRVPIPEDTRSALAHLAVDGEPKERRRAAVSLAVAKLYAQATPQWEEILRAVFEREKDPATIARATRALPFVWFKGVGDLLLTAYDRMPPGDERRQVAIEYRNWGTFSQIVARYDAARDATERADWVRVIGYKFGQGGPGAPVDEKTEEDVLCRIYPQTADPKTRAWLAHSWLCQARSLEPLIPLETDGELRALLERAATMPQDKAIVLLKEYFRR